MSLCLILASKLVERNLFLRGFQVALSAAGTELNAAWTNPKPTASETSPANLDHNHRVKWQVKSAHGEGGEEPPMHPGSGRKLQLAVSVIFKIKLDVNDDSHFSPRDARTLTLIPVIFLKYIL